MRRTDTFHPPGETCEVCRPRVDTAFGAGPLRAALEIMAALVADSRDPVLAATQRSFLVKLGLQARGLRSCPLDVRPEALAPLTAEAIETLRFMQARRRRATTSVRSEEARAAASLAAAV